MHSISRTFSVIVMTHIMYLKIFLLSSNQQYYISLYISPGKCSKMKEISDIIEAYHIILYHTILLYHIIV